MRRVPMLIACLALAACGRSATGTTLPDPDPAPVAVSGDAPAAARALGRGVNLGNILEAPAEGAWGLRLTDALFDAAKAAGVTTIRLPVRFSNHAGTVRPFPLDEAFMQRIDWAVNAALSRGMRIVLDMHHHRQLDGDALDAGEISVAPADLDDRFVAIWAQLAQRYRGQPETVLYELYNEPHGALTPARWNLLLARALAAVRAVDTTHYVIIGPGQWNSASSLAALVLPPVDQRIIVTIHDYEPFTFTHQGATWAGLQDRTGVTCCTDAQRALLVSPLDIAQQWSATWKRPVWVGEFGAYGLGPYASRVTYSRLAREAMESRGMTWAYWEFAAGFGFYDPATGAVRTELRDALFAP